jgi:RNA 3'-terminal phosphate cyclase
VLEIDGSRYSGSGSIVRQAVAFAALTGTAVHVFNVRVKRPKPGLRRQHAQTIEAVRQLVKGSTAGAVAGAGEFVFCPGTPTSGRNFSWDIGSAGSTTVLALALLPVLAFRSAPVSIDLRGGLFQDFAPSFYHLQYVLLPLLQRMVSKPWYAWSGRVGLSTQWPGSLASRRYADAKHPSTVGANLARYGGENLGHRPVVSAERTIGQ